MHTRRIAVAATFALFALPLPGTACTSATGAAEPLVRAHAASDLDCPDQDIRVEEKLGGRYRAVGCGRAATYRTACEGLTCEVHGEDGPAIPWKDRPPPP